MSLDTMSYHLSQDKTYNVTRKVKAMKTQIQYFSGNSKIISKTHKKTSYMLIASFHHLCKISPQSAFQMLV